MFLKNILLLDQQKINNSISVDSYKKEIGHAFYLPDNSPGPIFASLSAFLLANGFIMYFHELNSTLLFFGLAAIIFVITYGCRDLIRESTTEGNYIGNVRVNLYVGVMLFIASEVMFFVSLFGAYLDAALVPHTFIGNVGPPAGITPTIGVLSDINGTLPYFQVEQGSSYASLVNSFIEYFYNGKSTYMGLDKISGVAYYPFELNRNSNNGVTLAYLAEFFDKLTDGVYRTYPVLQEEAFFKCAYAGEIPMPSDPEELAAGQAQGAKDFIEGALHLKAREDNGLQFVQMLIPNKYDFFDYVSKIMKSFDGTHFPMVNTFLLVASGLYATLSLNYLKHNEAVRHAFKSLVGCLVFAFLFTVVQYIEYRHLIFGINDSVFGSSFYLTTGFHGLHVIIGSIGLIVCLFRLYFGHFNKKIHVGFETGNGYGHFVDIVGIFVFAVIYVGTQGEVLLPTLETLNS